MIFYVFFFFVFIYDYFYNFFLVTILFLFHRFIYPTASKFEVVLVAPISWEIVPDTSIKLEDWEHVTSFKNVHLAYEGTRSGFKEYICVGTNYNYSEDITSRGRVSYQSTILSQK